MVVVGVIVYHVHVDGDGWVGGGVTSDNEHKYSRVRLLRALVTMNSR